MVSTTVLVKNKTGLHARPASDLVQLSKRFASNIRLCVGETEVNPKSIISVLKAGIGPGTELALMTEGEDEAEAGKEIAAFIENLTE